MATALAQRIEHWPLDRLVPFINNPRTHSDAQVAQISRSVLEFGFTNPILVDSHGGVIAGHARLQAARQLKLSEVPVIVLDHLSETQKRGYVITDNQLALNAGWDDELLRLELQALAALEFDVNVLGFEDAELAALLEDEPTAGETDEDAVPAVQQAPVSARGDVWLLGPHRALCGDATDPSDVDRLLDGNKADLVFTDPPYNVDYEGYTEDRLAIKGDRMTSEQFQQFLNGTFDSFRRAVKTGASMYVCHASSWQREFENALEKAGFEVRCQIVWAKNTFAWGFGRYKFQHEPIFYCHVAGQSDAWYGDKTQSTLWHENKPAANRLHPTMKPVELVERALLNSSKAGDVVVDLFGGAGSTLIGCERRGRHARLMELDPKYVDVIVRRYREFTGKPVILEPQGTSFEEVQSTRLQEAA